MCKLSKGISQVRARRSPAMPRRVLLLLLVCAGLGRADDLSDGFRQPPPGARPQV